MSFHYNIFLFLHIVGVIIVLSPLPISIFLNRFIKKEENIEVVKRAISMTSKIPIITLIGFILIFLSGSAMVGANWFNFTQGNIWLALKQVLWFVILVLVLTLVRSAHNTLLNSIETETDLAIIKSNYKKIYSRGHMIDGLVLINILLATALKYII
jgi:H+/Cl- antiporter ClcA